MATEVQRLLTAEDFAQLPEPDSHAELVRGEVVRMSPAGHLRGGITFELGLLLGLFVRQQRLGKLYAAETGFLLTRSPDTVRAPDIAFVRAERLGQQSEQGFFDGAPDLAVEVVSPGDLDAEINEKVLDYLNAGTRLVWIVRPRGQTVTVYRSLKDVRILTRDEALDGADVLPGFSAPIASIFV